MFAQANLELSLFCDFFCWQISRNLGNLLSLQVFWEVFFWWALWVLYELFLSLVREFCEYSRNFYYFYDVWDFWNFLIICMMKAFASTTWFSAFNCYFANGFVCLAVDEGGRWFVRILCWCSWKGALDKCVWIFFKPILYILLFQRKLLRVSWKYF